MAKSVTSADPSIGGIRDFYAMAHQKDFARLHQFRIITWKWFGEDVLNDPQYKTFALYLETASLPSREITNLQVPYLGFNFNVPGMATYNGAANYPVVFRCDQSYVLRDIVEKQTRSIYDEANTTGNFLTPSDDSILTLGLLDKNNTPIKKYTLVGTAITNTGSISYNLGDSGTIAKVEATLSYHYWVNGTL